MKRYPRPTDERRAASMTLAMCRPDLAHLVKPLLQLIEKVVDESLERTHGAAARKQAKALLACLNRGRNA